MEKLGRPPATLAKSPTLGTGKSKSRTKKVIRRIAANVDGINLVTIITVFEDLAVAVVAGVIINALVFAWKSASRIRAVERKSQTEKNAKVYEIEGPLFFSSTNSFLEIFKPNEDPNLVIIDFANSKVIDQSALKAIEDIAERYSKIGKQVKLRHLTKDCHQLLRRTGQLIVDSDDDPDYGIAVDYEVKLGIFGK